MKSIKSYHATIYIAGDLNKIKDTCRKHCMVGACVSVFPCDFAYTGGMESGAMIKTIAYPRFPKTDEEILVEARLLAVTLMNDCYQRSCTIETPHITEYLENENITIPR